MVGRSRAAASVLVANGDAEHRASLAELLRSEGYAIREVATGEEAVIEASRNAPAVVLLEVHLPDVSGYEVCRALRDVFGDTLPIIFVSAKRTEAYDRVCGLLLGADDYVVEPFAPEELLARVRRFVARSRNASGAHDLTKREVEVLRLLAGGRNQADIAATLVITQKTVATHIQRILAKLGVHSRAEAVAAAYRRGMMAGAGHVANTFIVAAALLTVD